MSANGKAGSPENESGRQESRKYFGRFDSGLELAI
jgi:hypothetical protein